MKPVAPRNFSCRETGEPCTDTRCAQSHCCEEERLRAEDTRRKASAKDRAETSALRAAGAKAIKFLKPKISN